jgi:hypothetical protein
VPETENQIRQNNYPATEGSVVAVPIDGKHRFSKTPRLSISLTRGHGIEGDAHYGPFVRHRYLARRDPRAANLRQVHLIQRCGRAASKSWREHHNDGPRSRSFPLGTVLRLGASATVRLTGLRTPCVLIDRFEAGLNDELRNGLLGPRFRAGVMAVVSDGGEVSPGGPIRAVLPAFPHLGPSTALNRSAAIGHPA